MNITLQRTDYRPDGIFGVFSDENGEHFAVCLEHAYLNTAEPPTYAPKVPAGTYTCIRGQHQLAHMSAPFTAFELQNVPDHTNVLIHMGNYNQDSEGCLLIGTRIAPTGDGETQMITNSNTMFNEFMNIMQKDVDNFILTIKDK